MNIVDLRNTTKTEVQKNDNLQFVYFNDYKNEIATRDNLLSKLGERVISLSSDKVRHKVEIDVLKKRCDELRNELAKIKNAEPLKIHKPQTASIFARMNKILMAESNKSEADVEKIRKEFEDKYRH